MGSALTRDDPERIGGYWLAARLGAGGQGVVYEAYDASGARYALKTLHREADPVLRDRFAREAEAARRVAAFCTARILLARVDDDVPYLVSEYVPGPTLAAEVRAKGALGQDAVLRLATGVATALAAIHQAGVLHRDLKPGNVLLGPDGPRIIDFGIARAPDMSLTATGAIMGTFGYMAPEVLAGQRATQASDVFAWAAVVLYAATATEPFRGENIAEVAHRTATVDPDLGVLPPEIRPLMAAALAKDPQHRPTASDLLLGLVGAPVKAADPRAALMEAGARKAAAPAADTAPADGGTSPGTGAGHTVVEAPLGERAEAAFQALASTAQLAAHALLLRLTVPGSAADGSQDSVRTAGPAELLSDRPESERLGITAAVQGLAAAGVLLTDADGSVRPASAALLPAWRRLHAWIDTDRPGIDRLQRIGAAARLWQAHGERAEDLLRGTELRGCLDWLPTAPYHLRPNPLELRFLTAGRTAAARTARRRRQLLAGLAGTTVLALVAGGVAWTQNREAEQRRSQATARAVARTAEALPGTEPETAMLLGLASWRIAEVPEARAALIAAAVQPERSVVDIAGLEGTPEVMSPDGRRLVTVSPQGVRFWDVSKGAAGSAKPLATLSPKDYRLDRITDSAHAPAFSPDGKLMLLRGEDGSFRIVDTEDGTAAAPPIEAPDYQGWEGVSNSGHVLLTQTGTQGTVFDRSGRRGASQPTRTLDFQYAVTPDGTRFVSCVGQRVQVRPVDFGDPVIDEPAPDPTPRSAGQCSFRFSPDGRYLAVEQGVFADVYDLKSAEKLTKVRNQGSALRFSSLGRFLIGVAGETITVWDREDAERPLFTVALPTEDRTENTFEARYIALDEEARLLRHYSPDTGLLHEIDLEGALDRGARDRAASALSGDGRFAVLTDGHLDGPSFQVVDLRDGKRVGSPVTPDAIVGIGDIGVVHSAVDDDGRLLVHTRGEQGEGRYAQRFDVVVHDVRAGKELHRIPLGDDRRPAHLALSPNGRHLSLSVRTTGGQEPTAPAIEVWDLQRRKKIHEFKGHDGHGAFSRDSERLLTTTGAVLDLTTGTAHTGRLGKGGTDDVVASPDGRFVAALRPSGWLELWDGTARDRLARMPSSLVPGGARYGARLGAMAFSDDGRFLAVAVDDDAVQLWDTGARLPLGEPLTLTGQRIDTLSFDGTTLRTVTGDRRQALDLAPEKLAATVCRRVGRDITAQEWRTYVPDAPHRSLC